MFKPDLTIGPRHDPQTIRWHLVVFRGWQLSLHKWLRSDSDRALHDHKADNLSVILSPQGYIEVIREYWPGSQPETRAEREHAQNCGWKRNPDGQWFKDVRYERSAWCPHFRKAETLHRVILVSDRPVWTLWLRWPARRRWGYYCDERGWVDADYYNSNAQNGTDDYYKHGISEVGNGCG